MKKEEMKDVEDKIELLIVQDHKYTLDKMDEILKTKDEQLKRKDRIITLLIIILAIIFFVFLIGYYTSPPIKNQSVITDSEGNEVKFIEISREGDEK